MTELELNNIFSRYIAKILTDMENNPSYKHKTIIKKQIRFLQHDIEHKLFN